MYSDSFIQFVKQNIDRNPSEIALKSGERYDFSMSDAASFIYGMQKIKEKVPEWYFNFNLIIPARVSLEQSSSYHTAQFKQQFFEDKIVCDITGGFGVDSFYISKVSKRVHYYETNKQLASVVSHNFGILGVKNIEINSSEINNQSTLPLCDVIYCDPSRRDENNRRMYAIADCSPNISDLKNHLFEFAPKIVVKLSPMSDITKSVNELGSVSAVYIISVNNECKELLFVLDKNNNTNSEYDIFSINIQEHKTESFCHTLQQEREASIKFDIPKEGTFLYEPNSSILKSGAFKSVANTFGICKLEKSSHLYTSSNLADNFPGRVFLTEKIYPFKKQKLSDIFEKYPKANISVRNFPLKSEELRKKLKIEEGGEIYLFGTTDCFGEKQIICCKKY